MRKEIQALVAERAGDWLELRGPARPWQHRTSARLIDLLDLVSVWIRNRVRIFDARDYSILVPPPQTGP